MELIHGIDSLSGKRAARTERDSFIVPFSNNRLGLVRIAPLKVANVNVGENLQHSAQIEAD